MTVANNYAPIRQIGNGTTVQFSAAWSMIAAAYALVQLEDATTHVRTTVNQGVGAGQYQILITSSGFTVTMGTAPTSTQYLNVSRVTGLDQTDSYRTSKGFQGEVEENSFDKLTAAVQDSAYRAGLAITIPSGETTTTVLPAAALRASRVIAFDASGNVIVSDQTLATIEAGSTAASASAAAAAASASAASASQTAAATSATNAGNSATAAAASAAALPNAASIGNGNVPQSNGTSWTGVAAVVVGGNIGAATATTATVGDNSTKVATTAFVQANGGAVFAATVLTSGTGTYTVPTGCKKLRVRGVGGGGGGANGGSGGLAGSNGGNTTFGTAGAQGIGNGGGGAPNSTTGQTPGGVGGTASNGNVINIRGNNGIAAYTTTSQVSLTGGMGGAGPWGGSGEGGNSTRGAGGNGDTNSGSGGGGGQGNSVQAGTGGGAGGYFESIITSPAGTYAYAIGAGGAGGTSGATQGGTGGAGQIIIEPF